MAEPHHEVLIIGGGNVPLWKESRASWVVDRGIFPHVYWNLILKGQGLGVPPLPRATAGRSTRVK